jgi:hypothetical protein
MQQKKLNLNNQKQGVNRMAIGAIIRGAVGAAMKARKAAKATGGSKKRPDLKEHVGKGIKEDVARVSKAKTTTAKGAAKQAVEGGASRAKSRLAGRAAAVGAAAGAGFAAGKAMTPSTPRKSSGSPSGRADQIPGQASPGRKGLKVSGRIQDSTRGSATDRARSFAKGGGVFRESTAKKRRR